MKLCSKCDIEKDLTNFYKHSAICKECRKEIMRINRLNNANLWTRRYEKTKKGFLVRMYRNMTSRVKGVQKDYIHIYQGLDILPKEQFYEFALNNSEFHRLFKEWEDALYERRLCPSIDRIDTKFGYTLGNIQFLTMSENASKTSRRKYK
jgi:acetoin utilization deacetylase AcuC-like enzyme